MTSNRPIEEWGHLSDMGHTQTRPVVRRSMRKVSQSPWRLDRDRPRVLVRLNTSDVHALRAIFLDRELELALARRPQTIVDAGAFIGLSSLYFAWRYPNPKVIAIEPEKSNYELLLHNIDGWENIIAVRAALWKRSTRLCIHDPEEVIGHTKCFDRNVRCG